MIQAGFIKAMIPPVIRPHALQGRVVMGSEDILARLNRRLIVETSEERITGTDHCAIRVHASACVAVVLDAKRDLQKKIARRGRSLYFSSEKQIAILLDALREDVVIMMRLRTHSNFAP